MYVNRLPLPQLLQELIVQDRWKPPADPAILKRLTKIQGVERLSFLTVEHMQSETEAGHQIIESEAAPFYGLASSSRSGAPIVDPTILDVDQSVLIASNVDEEAICLDYRSSYDNPRVVASVWVNERDTRWEIIAPDFETFVLQLGL